MELSVCHLFFGGLALESGNCVFCSYQFLAFLLVAAAWWDWQDCAVWGPACGEAANVGTQRLAQSLSEGHYQRSRKSNTFPGNIEDEELLSMANTFIAGCDDGNGDGRIVVQEYIFAAAEKESLHLQEVLQLFDPHRKVRFWERRLGQIDFEDYVMHARVRNSNNVLQDCKVEGEEDEEVPEAADEVEELQEVEAAADGSGKVTPSP